MKKVIFSAAALMIGAVALGQTTSVSSEANFQGTPLTTPAINTTVIDNADIVGTGSAPGNSNTGHSVQNATIPAAGNSMKARQEGEKNSIVGFQTGASNLVSMRQTGNVNGNAADSGEANKIYSDQIGLGNDGRLEQQGDFNQIALIQDNATFPGYTGAVGNRADVQQGTADQAEKNYAAVQQYGDDNETKILQTYDNSDAFVSQAGFGNKVNVNQYADPENSQGHEALVEQFGDDNSALVNQNADGMKGRNYARVFSFGDNNQSEQTQTTDSNTRGNTALVNQGVDASITGVLFNSAEYANIVAIDNVMNGGANQASSYSQAIQDQKGHDNVAESHQFGAGTSAVNGDYTMQVQDGEDNEAYAFQNAYGTATGRGNSADTFQQGDDNYVATGQNGRNNDVVASQMGDDNSAIGTQRGRNHVMDLRQTGDHNAIEASQRGLGNSMVITQNGGHSWHADQDVPGGLPNGGNSLDVIQTGPTGALGTAAQTAQSVGRAGFTALAAPRSGSGL